MKRRLSLTLVLLGLVGLRADAFVRTTDTTTSVCLYWAARDVPWTLNEKGSNDPPFDTLPPVQAALERSFQAWQSVACTDITFSFKGTTPRTDIGYDPSRADNINLMIWREITCDTAASANDPCHQDGSCADKFDCWDHSAGVIALTTTDYNRDTGELVAADTEFNGSPDATGHEFRFTATVGMTPLCAPADGPTAACVSTDVQNTATHEIGHFIGLAHSPDPTATMFASASRGETSKRMLASDDMSGVCAIYPRGKPPVTCPAMNASPSQPGAKPLPGGSGGCHSASAGGVAFGVLLWALRRRQR
jgi:hypothetical protein